MRTVCLYVLTLSLLLIGGYRFFLGIGEDNIHSATPTHHIAKLRQSSLLEKQYVSPRLRAVLPSQQQQDELSVEDEDDDSTSVRRILLAKYFVTLVFASFLFFCYKDRYIRSFLSRQFFALSSGKYILQRALRI